MTRSTKWLLCLMALFSAANRVAAQSPAKPVEKPAEKLAEKPADDAAEKEKAARIAELFKQFNQPHDQLLKLARERIYGLRALQLYGPKKAIVEAKEQDLLARRSMLLETIDAAKHERDDTRKLADMKVRQVQDQFAENPAKRDTQLALVVQQFLPRLKDLKAEIERSQKLLTETDLRLSDIRLEKAALENEMELAGTPPALGRAGVSMLDTDDDLQKPSKPMAVMTPEALQEGLKELQEAAE